MVRQRGDSDRFTLTILRGRPVPSRTLLILRYACTEQVGQEIELLHDKVYMGRDTKDVTGFNMSDAAYSYVHFDKVGDIDVPVYGRHLLIGIGYDM